MVRHDASSCRTCGGPLEAWVVVPRSERDVHWEGRTFRVQGWRCLNCMARAIAERDFAEAERDLKPVRGTFMPGDGRRFASHETTRRTVSGD